MSIIETSPEKKLRPKIDVLLPQVAEHLSESELAILTKSNTLKALPNLE
jgi:hypothetical protein